MSTAGSGRLSRSASRIEAKPANGFHLLRIDGYSHTKTILPGQKLSSQQFNIGGHTWRVDYYPNGRAESNSDAISVYLQLIGHTGHSVQQARYKFSLLDHAGIPAYELPAESASFTSTSDPDVYTHLNRPSVSLVRSPAAVAGVSEEPGPGCGHEEFIGKDDLEKRRGDLIRDDSIVIRCDVGVTQIVGSCLAQEELIDDEEEDDEEDYDYGSLGYGYVPPRRHRRQRRPDDEYVKSCLNREPGGSRGRRHHGGGY